MAICMVCNNEVEGGVVCPRCCAQKHQDCHEYFPACSRYGCGGVEERTQNGNAEITLLSIIGGVGFALYLTDGPNQGLYILSAIGLGGLCGLLVCYARKHLGVYSDVKSSSLKYILSEDRRQIEEREQKMLEYRVMNDL